MNLWLHYPLTLFLRFWAEAGRAMGREPRAHILRIGPIAFAVIWRGKIEDHLDP